MSNNHDANSLIIYSELIGGDGKNGTNHMGTLTREYWVSTYQDTRMNQASTILKTNNRKYLLHCTQRVCIPNFNAVNLQPQIENFEYTSDPIILQASVGFPLSSLPTRDGVSIELVDYSPRTINTQVEQSGSSGTNTGATNSISSSSTIGSSHSETNSFGVNISESVGLSDVSASASSNFENSTTNTSERSRTSGSEASTSRGSEASISASMSIKDWGCYCMINDIYKMPVWTFGQEYPWNAIKYRRSIPSPSGDLTGNQDNLKVKLAIPTATKARLYDGEALLPPSTLSQFGIDFVMKATWLVAIDNDTSDVLEVNHDLKLYTGSHRIENKELCVYMDIQPSDLLVAQAGEVGVCSSFNSGLNLSLLGLEPLGIKGVNAIIGFIPSKFIIEPKRAGASSAPTSFKLISSRNNLCVQDVTSYPKSCPPGAGFMATDDGLAAAFVTGCSSLRFVILFKVVDSEVDYILHMKHWKTGAEGIQIEFNINDKYRIVRFVDDLEAQGGSGNLLSIALRNIDYASNDYHDYLQLGLNSIEVTMTPLDQQSISDCGYQLRALSIEG
jgi:hypothetical protein